jgi:hypothetical protein
MEIISEDNNRIYCTIKTSGKFTEGDKDIILKMGGEGGRVFLDNFEGHHSSDGFFITSKEGNKSLNVSSLGRFNGNDFDEIFGQLGMKLEGNEINLGNGVRLRASRYLDE